MGARYDYQKYKVAAIQAASVIRDAPEWFDLKSTLEKAVGLIEEAGRNGARLIAFPEAWIPCYTYFSLDMTDRLAFKEMWFKYLTNSVEVPGRETEALGQAAKRANAYVAVGISERDRKFQGRMYNSILFLNPSGEVLGVHRKISPTFNERLFWTPGDGGENLRAVFETEIGNIGGSICGEHAQLTLLHNWLLQGIQVHCSLWPGHTGYVEKLTDLRTRALCCNLAVYGIIAAAYFPEESRPKNFHRNSHFSSPGWFRGGSGIVDPYGDYVAGPVYDKEAIVYGDIDLAEVDKSRDAINLVGLYSRWDLININVRQEAYEPLAPMGAVKALTSEPDRTKDLEARVKQLEEEVARLSSRRNRNKK